MKCLVLIALLLSAVKAAPSNFANSDSLRLPTNSVPIRYELSLSFSVVGTNKFTGKVKIFIEIKEKTDTITLHSRGLSVTKVELTDNLGEVVENMFGFEEEKDFLYIITDVDLLPGEKLTLEISYSGQLTSNLLGIYRSTYKVGEETSSLIATQLGMEEARTVFVCYDEPGFKASFALTLEHETGYFAISNAAELNRSQFNGIVTTVFDDTPIMSPYLLAFIVSDYDFNSNEETMTDGDIIHRIYTRKEAIASTSFALYNSQIFLKELVSFLSHNFELSKIFHASVPDFYGNAMENYGLIMYRESVLIGDEDSHHFDVLRILQVVAHELAHQFFGNLVTCRYLDAMWLNEGFAVYFEHKLIENSYPDLRSMDFFNVQKLQNAFQVDALESTHPLTYDGETLRELVYDKPASVIRMFAQAVGETTVRKALGQYLIHNAHTSVMPADLYAAFEEAISESGSVGFNFTAAFSNWETTKGFPLVHVSVDATSFRITQQRYYAASEERVQSDTRSWYIPLSFATQSNQNFDDTTFTDWFLNGDSVKTIAFPAQFNTNQWFIFNKQQIGVYRVNYDAQNWNRIIEVLNSDNFEQIHILNRAQLIDDALNLAVDGYLDYQIAFGVLSYLSRETDYIPWRAAVTNLDKLELLMTHQSSYSKFQRFIRHLNRRMFVTYGIEDKNIELLPHKFARELSVDLSCRMGDETCLTKTAEYLNSMVNDNKSVSAKMEVSYICNGLRGINKSIEFETIFMRMQNSNDQSERIRLIDGLLCSPERNLISDLLASILINNTQSNYRHHERQRIFNNIFLKSSQGFDAVIDFISNSFDQIVSTFSTAIIDSIMLSLSKRAANLNQQEKLTELKTKLSSTSETTKQRMEINLKTNQNWTLNHYSEIETFLDGYFAKLDEVENQLRLPSSSVPLGYKIHIDARNIHTGDRDYSGQVEIDAYVLEATDHIIVHSRSQIINEVRAFNAETSEEIILFDYHLYPAADTLTLYFMNTLEVNSTIIVKIKYSTTMTTYEAGFYQTSYLIDGERRYLGATQFQGTDARFAFPHYEEPHLKAIFELSITHTESYKAIANTFGSEVNNQDGTITTSFAATPPMSSYLLAFIVSDLEAITNEYTKGVDDTLHRVWVRPDSLSKAAYALKNSEDVLKALEEYVGFNYELPKVDSAGVPNKGGAMENWGMVTYRENAMIYEENPDDVSHAVKISGINVISHEMAHQFLGDSVTCEWWDYIWMNEGFATLFEFELTGMVHPDWNTQHFFNIRKLHNSFRNDAIETVNPMRKSVLTPQEILGAFDFVVYDKAGSVLRMFQNLVGENIFRASLKLFLETNNHKSVNSQHLIDAFSTTMTVQGLNSFDFDVAFKTWELQAGFPLITVTLDTSGQFMITQQRYFTQKKENSNDTSSWYIPLNFATASNPNFEDTTITNFFVNGDASYVFSPPAEFDASQWFVFNKQQVGYYRVNYDSNNWNALISVLNSDDYDKIHVLNRVQLVDDSITLAAGGYLDYETTFGILTYLVRETEYTPWFSADRFISTLYTTFGTKNNELNTFVLNLSEKFYDRHRVADFEFPVEGVYARYNRELAMKLACNAGSATCMFDTYVFTHAIATDQIKNTKGMESVTFCSGLRGSTNETQTWESMWQKLLISEDSVFRTYAINALGCSDNSSTLKEYLETTVVSNSGVEYSLTERRSVFSSVLSSYSGLDAVINFLNDYQLDILWKYEYDNLEPILVEIARTIKTNEQQFLFNGYLQSLTHLDPDVSAKVSAIVNENFQAQKDERNIEIMEIIRKITNGEVSLTTISQSNSSITTIEASTDVTFTSTSSQSQSTASPSTQSSTQSTETTTSSAQSVSFKLFILIICSYFVFLMK